MRVVRDGVHTFDTSVFDFPNQPGRTAICCPLTFKFPPMPHPENGVLCKQLNTTFPKANG